MTFIEGVLDAVDQRIEATTSDALYAGTIVEVSPLAVKMDGSGLAVPMRAVGGLDLREGNRVIISRVGKDFVVTSSYGERPNLYEYIDQATGTTTEDPVTTLTYPAKPGERVLLTYHAVHGMNGDNRDTTVRIKEDGNTFWTQTILGGTGELQGVNARQTIYYRRTLFPLRTRVYEVTFQVSSFTCTVLESDFRVQWDGLTQ